MDEQQSIELRKLADLLRDWPQDDESTGAVTLAERSIIAVQAIALANQLRSPLPAGEVTISSQSLDEGLTSIRQERLVQALDDIGQLDENNLAVATANVEVITTAVDRADTAAFVRLGVAGPESLALRIESLIECCHVLADQLDNAKLASTFSRIATSAERAAAEPTRAKLKLLQARFAKAYFAATEAGSLELPKGLQAPAPPARPSDDVDFEWSALGIALLMELAWQRPELDCNPLGLKWQHAEQQAVLSVTIHDKPPPVRKQIVDQTIRSCLVNHHRYKDGAIDSYAPVTAKRVAEQLTKCYDRTTKELQPYVTQGFSRLFPNDKDTGFKTYQAYCKVDRGRQLLNWFLREFNDGKAFTVGAIDVADWETAEQQDSLNTMDFDS